MDWTQALYQTANGFDLLAITVLAGLAWWLWRIDDKEAHDDGDIHDGPQYR